MGYLGLPGAECLMKTPKGFLSHGFTSFSPSWQGRYEWQRMLVRAIGKAWQPCQVMVDQESEEWLQLEMGFTCSDLLPSVRPRLPKVPQPRTVTASSSQKGFRAGSRCPSECECSLRSSGCSDLLTFPLWLVPCSYAWHQHTM